MKKDHDAAEAAEPAAPAMDERRLAYEALKDAQNKRGAELMRYRPPQRQQYAKGISRRKRWR